ncbi:hypothetical protein cypCar_00008028 [Cyprinus carpio]|nr:hypothetical protein cypCar_00008028 [Cyprinus carpio]
MGKFGLQFKATLENITNVRPVGDDFRWYLKDSMPLKGGQGSASMVQKCKLCSRENSIVGPWVSAYGWLISLNWMSFFPDILRDTITPYNAEDSERYKTIVQFECRGLEPVDFQPQAGFAASGAETSTQFPEINLQEKDWTDYDEKASESVGIYEFEKPGARDIDYPDMAKEAGQKALKDAGIKYSAAQQACVDYVYGNSTCGQRAIYHSLGLSGILIINVNNNCSTGSTALFMARQLIQGGLADCVLAFCFEKMERGSLLSKYMDRTNTMDKHMEVMINRYKCFVSSLGTKPQHFAKIAWKNHKHSTNNPYVLMSLYSQFRDEYSLEQVINSRKVFEYLTLLQCCPTSDGAGAAVLGSEKFAGYDMTHLAAQRCFDAACLKLTDVDVIELHDYFSTIELITYEALGLYPEGKAGELIDQGDNTYGGKKADCTISMSDSDLLELMTGQLNPQKKKINAYIYITACLALPTFAHVV